jgi:AI-2 transport protein TqsA
MPTSPPAPVVNVRGARLLFVGACLVVVVAGLDAAEAFFLPLLMALFLTILCVPPLTWLRGLGLPRWLATALVLAGAALAVLVVAVIIGGTVQRFYQELPFYRARLDGIVQSGLAWLGSKGIELSPEQLSAEINTGAVMDLAATTASSLVAAFSGLVLVLLLTGFMLLELPGAPRKLRAAMGDPEADLGGLARGARQVQMYLGIKTAISLLTGVLALGICLVLGIEFALLWGLLAFLFNYVPNVGSILAGIPPVLLGLIQVGPAHAALVGLCYLILNFLIGTLLEPRLMGRRLGLSPLVVLLSLIFWGWLWGPVGMLLSVPLTSALKLLLEQTEDLRWVAVLLGSGEDDPAAEGDRAGEAGATMPDK